MTTLMPSRGMIMQRGPLHGGFWSSGAPARPGVRRPHPSPAGRGSPSTRRQRSPRACRRSARESIRRERRSIMWDITNRSSSSQARDLAPRRIRQSLRTVQALNDLTGS